MLAAAAQVLFTGTSRLEPIKAAELTSERDLLLSSVVFYFTASRRNDYYRKTAQHLRKCL